MAEIKSDNPGAALVVGVGAEQGLGAALCRRFAREGLRVYAAGRNLERLESVAEAMRKNGLDVTAVALDATDEAAVCETIERLDSQGPPLELVAYNAGNNRWSSFVDMSSQMFEDLWRVCCLGGFLVGREAAKRMLTRKRGSILFTGASASLRGRPAFGGFASAKAGVRMVAQAMARELGPQGLHVAHVVVDGVINGEMIRNNAPDFADRLGDEGMLNVDEMADAFWSLHTQGRSAWTHELDVRPFGESW